MNTAKQWIEAFDKGETVNSVSMGGLGGGYETAIQSLVVGIVRRLIVHDVPKNNDKFASTVTIAADVVVDQLDNLPGMGFTGAQVGAAKNLAAIIWRRGPGAFSEVPDRIIQIGKGKVDQLAKVVSGEVGETPKVHQ